MVDKDLLKNALEGSTDSKPSLFEQLVVNNPVTVSSTGRQLSKTAVLTQLATNHAREIKEIIESNQERFAEQFKASQSSHDAMDQLIADCIDLSSIPVDFLQSESMEELEKMIRSQQSKRSRAISKQMSLENYTTMLVGAICENLLRIAANKPKSSGGYNGSYAGLTPEKIEEYTTNVESLKKAIRNVQSKISIAKSKNDFDEKSDKFLALLDEEAQLKSIRSTGSNAATQQAIKALEVTEEAKTLLVDVDTDNIDLEDAKDLLDRMKNMLLSE